MKNSRLARTIFAVIFLILFGVYIYLTHPYRTMSSDLADWGPAGALKPREQQEEQLPTDQDQNAPQPTGAEPEQTPEPTPEPTPTVDPDSPAGRAAALGLPAPPDVDITSWELMLVNAAHKLDSSYAPPTVVQVSDSKCPQDSRIEEALLNFKAAAEAEGLSVYLSSGYRSYSEQSANLQRKLNQGYDYATAITIVAEPGTSEHQTGLACDITDRYYELKDFSLENTELFQWMSAHCQEYGFIVRYPKDKSGNDTTPAAQSVTGIIYEPWHFRYVGVEAATYIMENGLCLEEFVALYE